MTSFARQGERANGRWPHHTINLSVVAGRYNMLDCIAGIRAGNATEPGPSERRAVGFLGVWP